MFCLKSLVKKKRVCDCGECKKFYSYLDGLPNDTRYRVLMIKHQNNELKKATCNATCNACGKSFSYLYDCPWGCSLKCCEYCWTLGVPHLSKKCIDSLVDRIDMKGLENRGEVVFTIIYGMKIVKTHNKHINDFHDWFYEFEKYIKKTSKVSPNNDTNNNSSLF